MANETVEILCQKAQQAVARGQTEQARQYYLQALQLQAASVPVHYGLATIYYLLKDWPSAAQHFKEVTRLEPQRAGAYINLGAVYNKMDRLEEAVNALRRGIQLDLTRAEGYYNLALVYRRQGQCDLAIQAYKEAVRVNPRMTDAHFNLANLYLEREQYDQALVHYQKALELRPKWDKAQHGLMQARSILEEKSAVDGSAQAALDKEEPPTAYHLPDPEALLKPEKHAVTLTKLHKATIESQAQTQDFADILQHEIEPAIKALSSRLLQPQLTSTELDQIVQKVEEALAHMEAAQENFDKRMDKIQKYSNRLLKS